jgi:two-component system, NarL family, response regulator DevR
MIRVFLVDDHEIVRRGLVELIESDGDMVVVGEAGTAEEALSRIPPTRPDVAVLDVRLPDGNGIEVCREVRARHPEIACLMLTSFADDEALVAALMAGAAGFVLKQVRGAEIVDDVRKVAEGQTLLSQAAVRRVVDRITAARGDDELALLTPQEHVLLDHIAEGLTNRQIGEQMHLAEKTVKNYVSNLLAKLGMSRRTEAAVFAARLAERRRVGSGLA